MKNTIITTILGILLIGLMSATSISPNNIELNISAGDQKTIEMIIDADEDSIMEITSDNPNCVIDNRIYNVTQGLNYENLTFYVPADADLSSKECNFNFEFLNISEIILPVNNGGSEGGHGGSCYEKNWTCKNITNCTDGFIKQECKSNCNKIKYQNISCSKQENNSTCYGDSCQINGGEVNSTPLQQHNYRGIIYTGIALFIILILYYLYKKYMNKNSKKE